MAHTAPPWPESGGPRDRGRHRPPPSASRRAGSCRPRRPHGRTPDSAMQVGLFPLEEQQLDAGRPRQPRASAPNRRRRDRSAPPPRASERSLGLVLASACSRIGVTASSSSRGPACVAGAPADERRARVRESASRNSSASPPSTRARRFGTCRRRRLRSSTSRPPSRVPARASRCAAGNAPATSRPGRAARRARRVVRPAPRAVRLRRYRCPCSRPTTATIVPSRVRRPDERREEAARVRP
jgi:hypothetical protein